MKIITKSDQQIVIDSYLDLLKSCLTGYIYDDGYRPHVNEIIQKFLSRFNMRLMKRAPYGLDIHKEGKDYPFPIGLTMIGLGGLENLQFCITDILQKKVPGDFIETGAWRGGATIFMRAVLKTYNVTDRVVWVADSFEGQPKPDITRYPNDEGEHGWKIKMLNVSLQEVKANFARYKLLDKQVRFLVGRFKDTLPSAPIKQLSLLRLDGDTYESTFDALQTLYPKLSVGGYIIIDDYFLPRCKAAVLDFRKKYKIKDPIIQFDWTRVYWKRSE